MLPKISTVIDDYFQVTCFEGKVKVISDQKEYILNPTDSFRKINGLTKHKETFDIIKFNL